MKKQHSSCELMESFSANNSLLDVVSMALKHFNGKTQM
jgi:hypothetical protein